MTELPRFSHKGYVVEVRSYEVLAGPHNPAGWVPSVWLWSLGGEKAEVQPLSLPSQIKPTREEANVIAQAMARQWIDVRG